nr:PREDICTED: uncharacterized protein LOC108218302 isoform X2 [Daucus carota subsp. sativus]
MRVEMAKATGMLFNFVQILLLLLLIISVADAGSIPLGIGFKTVVCNKVYGAENGDTCSTVSAALNITPDFFGSINPNLNCSNIFVSEWLCINGTLI